MTTTERRRIKRDTSMQDATYIEIEHSFGSTKKSVFKVLEYTENGLSFLIPFSEGYFLVGTPLKLILVQASRQIRRIYSGLVRYYLPYYLDNGEKFYKIGVEINAAFRDLAGQSLRLRAERISADQNQPPTIRFVLDNDVCSFELADFSRYAAAFYCSDEDLIRLKPSSVLKDVAITVENARLFEGTATIIRTYPDNTGRLRVVIQPRGNLIDTTALQRTSAVRSAASKLSERITKHLAVENLDIQFKASVADLRYFMEDMRAYLEEPRFQVEECNQQPLLEELFGPFFAEMDRRMIALDGLITKLSLNESDQLQYRAYYQQHLLPLFTLSPYLHRCYFKPLGYSGDYEMMWRNHENAFWGSTLFSKMLSRYSTSLKAGVAAVNRTFYIKDILAGFLKTRMNQTTNILSVACGPALEIRELLKEQSSLTNNLKITLLDQEVNALEYALNQLYEQKIRTESSIEIDFVHQNLQDFLRGVSGKNPPPTFQLIYSFGLFDYFEKAVAKVVISGLLNLLAPGGKLIIANVSLDGFNYRSFLEFGTDWFLVYRTTAQLAELGQGLGKGYTSTVDEIEDGFIKFLTILKPEV